MPRIAISVLLALFASLIAAPSRGIDTPAAKTHWAFQPPVRPLVPETQHPRSAIRNDIDRFILSRLDKEKLKPSPEADRVTLCRRLYLDLVGLPPTPKEVDEFVADKRADAYERLVEKLLASPHYGERWARWWLDAARFADSDGYEKDMSRQVWAYRDYVISAFNRDLPFDQFAIEQIAGDLLPNPTQDQIVATGFLRMSMLNEEGGVDPEQFRMDAMFDRMDAVGKAFLGLSVACAQCHDHKFDPISQEEYYRLFAYLNNDHEAQRVVYTVPERMTINRIRTQITEIETKLKEVNAGWEKQLAKWEESVKKEPSWKTVAVENAGDNSQRYIPQKDGSILAQGYAPTKFSTLMRGASPTKKITAFRIEQLNDPNLPCGGPGRSFMGTSALSEFIVEVESAKEPGKRTKVKFVKAVADYANPERSLEPNFDDKVDRRRVTGPVEFAIDGKDDTAWGIDAGPGRRNVPRVAVFVPEKPIELPDGGTLHFSLKQMHGGWNSDDHMNNNLGRFRLSVTDDVKPDDQPLPLLVRKALAVPTAKRNPGQAQTVFSHWRTTAEGFKDTNEKIEALWKEWPEGSTSLVAERRADPRATSILKRGDFLRPGAKVNAGVPAFMHALPKDAEASRLTLAKWLVDKKSPTTARAIVNRVWQVYFGAGLMTSPEEFGLQGNKPTHPELLDWLASEFMNPAPLPQPAHEKAKEVGGLGYGSNPSPTPPPRGEGLNTASGIAPPSFLGKGVGGLGSAPWSLKHLHRLIVTSATYRQSSRVTPELLAKDPENKLLARGARFRTEGEIVRDIALAASGLLNSKIGGPSVFTPAPDFLFKPPASYGPFEWVEARGEDRYRRALYTFRRRSTPYPALTVFDVPVGEASCVKRTRTNTPLQALTGLNETIFVESARALGKRAVLEGGKTDTERLTFAFRLCVSRKPTADELAILSTVLENTRKRFEEGEANAAEVATGTRDHDAKPEGLTFADWGAFTMVARVLLNLDETVTKE
ncbi:hypothetical protein VT84_00475 [Gemmata sp. SH-PL17]|uniref:DUF1549 and DUF1553 domain-containing protein n=1 Tax=Gemmata sp. SH-PL17 TaxID=1630693 RepID=UPI00078C1844|nr:DUF1549 and DUF1553 domain-containing protein [Gemmata sp. SH-PL17]AMV22853.1 hypothetical protein VT84_00475 [Gemmata sp. SH-PL17]